jgi:ribosomal protein S11
MKKIIFTLLIIHCSLVIANAQWVPMSNGITESNVLTLAANGNSFFAGTANWHGIFVSTNNGLYWNQTSLNNLNISSLIVNSNTIYAGTNNGVFISTNNGSTWTQTGEYIKNILSLAANGNSIFAGSNYNGVYKSTDNGISWIQTTLNNQAIWSLLISGNNIFAGTNGFGIYLSTNNGTSWTHMGLDNRPIISFAIIGNNIFAGTATSGVYLTTNDGITWVQTSLNDKVVYSLTPSGNNIFAGVQNSPNDSGGVYLSTNNGTTWIKKNQGFNVSLSVNTLLITNDYIFAGTTQSVWRRNLSEILSEVQNIITEIPSKYSLLQNYPNPFNPTTTIKFDIPKSSNVKISVYDITGKEFGVLVNEKLQAGTYQTNWNASNFPSGIYFYRIQAGDFSETKKLILLK